MSTAPLVFEGTGENFSALVLENSTRGPVLVNYWSPKAGPCLRLYPLLDKLVHEFGGQFLLVNVDADKQRRAAGEYGVTSLPTLKLFRDKQVVETVHGYQLEGELRCILQRHMACDTDSVLIHALRTYKRGETDRGLTLLAEAAMPDPARASLRESVIWARPDSDDARETTQEMAADYVRMACAEIKNMRVPEGNPSTGSNKRILVVGGGIARPAGGALDGFSDCGGPP